MKRRALFGRLATIAAAVAVAPAVKPVEADLSEDERIRALVDDVLANPGKHPEIETRARELRGETHGRLRALGSGVTYNAQFIPDENYQLTVRNTGPTGRHMRHRDQHGKVIGWEHPKLEAMRADCVARGCLFGGTTNWRQANGLVQAKFRHGVPGGESIEATYLLRDAEYTGEYTVDEALQKADEWRCRLHGSTIERNGVGDYTIGWERKQHA